MQNTIVWVGIGANVAIAVTCSFLTWQLSRFRYRLKEWDGQLIALSQELQQTLSALPQKIRTGQQQLKQGRYQASQLQQKIYLYRQWTVRLTSILQWGRLSMLRQNQTR